MILNHNSTFTREWMPEEKSDYMKPRIVCCVYMQYAPGKLSSRVSGLKVKLLPIEASETIYIYM